jgi:phospholipid-binding lipoprotein MlaA
MRQRGRCYDHPAGLDAREAHGDDIDKTKATALDPYATFRSLYRQFRGAQAGKARQDRRATVPVWFPQAANQTGQ